MNTRWKRVVRFCPKMTQTDTVIETNTEPTKIYFNNNLNRNHQIRELLTQPKP